MTFSFNNNSLPSLDKLLSEVKSIPLPAASAIASASQLSSELARSIGGMGVKSKMMPENSADTLMAPSQTTKNFKLSLTSKQNGATVTFDVSPSIDESRSANYEHLAPVHHPGTIQVYKSTESRQFNITAKLIARTAQEASRNLRYINLIRAWVMPYYGQGTFESSDGSKLGGPPDILDFNAYGATNISNLPVVLTSYHWVYPDNVDYIPSEEGIPFPVIMDVSLSLIESYSPEQYTSFNISAYRDGDMTGAYTFSSSPKIILPDADVASDNEANMKAAAEGFPRGYF